MLLAQPQEAGPGIPSLYVIDWEYAQHGHRAFDLGQMVGDFLERHHFASSPLAIPMLESFVSGYGPVDEDTAFCTAMHAGAHMLGWFTRRDINGPLPAPLGVCTEFVEMAVGLLVKGWEGDRNWLEKSAVGCLFEAVEGKSRMK